MQYAITLSQSWNVTGNSGLATSNFLGSTDNHDVIFRTNNAERGRLAATGFWRFGNATNYAKVDSTGTLTFGGTGAYKVTGNKYAFQYTGNTNYGLFFNSTNVQYEFRNGSAVPVFSVNANTGNSVFNGTLKIGAYTLPSTDGTNGQTLTTDGKGTVSWSNVSGSSGANTSLSNLAAPTAINAGLLPKTNNSISLGSSGNGWVNIYIDSALYIGGIKFLTANTTSGNTVIGLNTLSANTGINNTATGFESLYANTTGSDNTANGVSTLYSNTTGNYNTANGVNALYSNTTGDVNTANGYRSLYFNTTGEQNTATGYAALENNNGNYNSAHGTAALNNNTSGAYNTANGASALLSNTTGSYNTSNGTFALDSNTTGSWNTANGYGALFYNTTGGYNTANGYGALASNIVGFDNTANGESALYSNITGFENTANGSNALFYNTTGAYNTANGYGVLASNTTGSGNTALGALADVSYQSVLSNATVIGYNAVVDASNKVSIGNTDVFSIGGQVGWTSFSDGRYKKNIKEDVQGLRFINLLKPITYTVDIDGLNTHYDNLRKHDSAYDKAKAQVQSAADAASKIIYNGFIAQDVEKAAQSINYNFSGVDKPQNKDGLYGLRYSDFVVPLVKAVQELSKMNDAKDSAIQQQNIKITDLQNQINALKAMIAPNQSTSSNQSAVVLTNANALQQNIPNPFTNSTNIAYSLNQKFTSAQIVITDKDGRTIKAVNVSGGKGNVTVDASTLSSGAYQYSLVVDGRLIDTKQMELFK